MKKKIILVTVALIFLILSSTFSQTIGTSKYSGYVPRDTSKTMWDIGAGIGVPYGTIGGKLSVGNKLITGDIGLGMLPFAWTPIFSASGVVHFRDRYADVRPKITLAFTNVAAAILILGEGSFDTMYEETFPGFGIYAGFDWRLSKTSPFCIDLNIGWVFPFVGTDEIEKKYDEVTSDFRSRGYSMTSEMKSLDTPKISIGLIYSHGRSLK